MRLLWALVFCAAPALLRPAEGAAWLKIPQGARSVALGTAVSATRGGAESLWYSPAQVAALKGLDLSFSRQAWLGDSSSDYLSLGTPLGSWASLGAMAQLSSAEDTYRDALGKEGASFTDQAWLAGLALGARAGWLRLGLLGKWISETYAGTVGTGFAGDVGLQLDLGVPWITIGGAAQNLGTLQSYAVDLPLTYRGGLALHGLIPHLLLSVDTRILPRSQEAAVLAGAEGWAEVGPFGFALRAGFDSAAAEAGSMAGWALGAGARLQNLKLDFAWTPYGALGSPYRMTLGWDFAAWPPEKRPVQRAQALFPGPPPPGLAQ